MRKLRFYLPLVQTAMAVLLMFLNWRKHPWTTGSTLECNISYCMNAPIAFIGPLLARIRVVAVNNAAWFTVSYLLYLALVALLWYAVALEMSGSGGSTIMSLLARRQTVRRIADAVLVVIGLFFGFLMLGLAVYMHRISYKELPIPVGFLLWGFVIAWFYGRDFWITLHDPLPQ